MTLDLTAGVTAARGFSAAGVAAGLKRTGAKDLALVVNGGPRHQAAGLFTSNRVFAAPVAWSRQAVKDGRLVAVALNSGGANACTGPAGWEDAAQTARLVAQGLACPEADVAVCSTGLIGQRLDMAAVALGVGLALKALAPSGGADAAHAIMTTDTKTKQAAHRDPAGWTIGGMAKGAGMLAPGLATMLVVLTTDADIESNELRLALWAATSVSFDRADSDGCMSTNDSVLLLASGASGTRPDLDDFSDALTAVCVSLARQLIADAEGAEHEITIQVSGAASEEDAVEVARAVARSNLFKCAIAGADPNWGRVLAAVGTTQAAFDPDLIDVAFNGVEVFRQGTPGADRSQVDLTGRQVQVDIDLHAGRHQGVVWTNDLTHGYVSENADYSS
ncbi:MAG: bifunctional glutamate N-acetyltransferase/amino-acid acetyltransferase ArgJ [Propionibacteriaceae bacterium]|jgi:glutamate N-acetyltransferase/amino-acid N-acetyltransferase|nr:bifunctional glutamate N-acetyltransferase/amino-acid acetyltransferase ArgJ [Propionibacteriaceae bacterium]